MPSLHLFGRQWQLSADTVPILSFIFGLFHASWVVVLGSAYWTVSNVHRICSSNNGLDVRLHKAAFYGLFVVFATSLVLEFLIVGIGLTGGPLETDKRKAIRPLLFARIAMFGAQTVFVVYALVVIYTRPSCWESKARSKDIWVPWTSLALTILEAVMLLITRGKRMKPHKKGPVDPLMGPPVKVKRWNKRLKLLGFLGRCSDALTNEVEYPEVDAPIQEISRALARLVKHIDLEPSDVALGCILVALLQRKRRLQLATEALRKWEHEQQVHPSCEVVISNSSSSASSHSNHSAAQTNGPHVAVDMDEHSDDLTGEVAGGIAAGPPFRPGVLFPRISWSPPKQKMLVPSRAALKVKPELPPSQVADIITGARESVPTSVIQVAKHWATYAAATYGRSGFVFNQPSPAKRQKAKLKVVKWRLGREKISLQNMTLQQEVAQDTEKELDFRAMVEFVGVDADDVVYVNYKNTALGELPYMTVLDRQHKTVVLSIRGTSSVEDMVTDLYGQPEEVPEDWLPDRFKEANPDLGTCYAHQGMFASTRSLLADLNRHKMLSLLLLGEEETWRRDGKDVQEGSSNRAPQGAPADSAAHQPSPSGEAQQQQGRTDVRIGVHAPDNVVSEEKEQQGVEDFAAAVRSLGLDCKGWQLVVTGHSLGAGVAAIITLKLRQRFHGAVCWAFNPPGGLVSKNLSDAMAPFTTAIAVHKDAVTRTSLSNINGFMDEMVVALARCRWPKLLLLISSIFPFARSHLMHHVFLDYTAIRTQPLQIAQQYFQGRRENDEKCLQPVMVPPKNLVFLRRVAQGVTKGMKKMVSERPESEWDCVYVEPVELIGEGVLISSSMAKDHYSNTLHEAIDSCLKKAGVAGDLSATR